MKRLLAIVLVCGLVLPVTATFAGKDDSGDSTKSPTVTSPNGGESWKTGTTRVIKWNVGSGFNFVKIQLLKSGKHYKWVSKKTKSDGKHTWKIPATIATSRAYKIKITATNDNKLTDTSNKNFTITKIGGGGSSLSVTRPNGGQKWTTGKKYAIKWNKGNAGAYVKIQLLKSGKHSLWMSKKTKNDGKYTWRIPSSVATSSAYKIRIASTSKSTVKDLSDKNFKITNAASTASCTSFLVYYWGNIKGPEDRVWVEPKGSKKRAHLHLSCPHALYFLKSTGGWGSYYSRFVEWDTMCVGDTATFTSPNLPNNKCTITKITVIK